jgi:hypothetical protein
MPLLSLFDARRTRGGRDLQGMLLGGRWSGQSGRQPASCAVVQMARSVSSKLDGTLRPTAPARRGSRTASVPHYLRSAAMLANEALNLTALRAEG